ncbi:MAG: lysophospholipase [Hyphomonadaceae bacterium]|nr:lysophospholipase [Hyphomonadaceae bacterium]MBX3511372.1 lysophospholipase [Hyphomonadaceae bacterium]
MEHNTEAWSFGRALRGYAWRTGQARASVLITHGFAEYAERYAARYHQLAPKLNARGFDVYGWDMRGHGRSPGARGVTDLRAALDDLGAARRALAAQGKPLFLFGHSLGGLVTAASVAGDDAGVAGVILSAPALLINAPAHLRAIAGLVSVIAPGARLAPPLDTAGLSRIREEIAAYQNDPMVSDPRVPARTGATAIAVSEAAWARYPAWRTPVLVLHGLKDTATDPQGSRRFIAAIAAADKQLELFAEGRHELLNDLDRDEALAKIIAWLDQRAR